MELDTILTEMTSKPGGKMLAQQILNEFQNISARFADPATRAEVEPLVKYWTEDGSPLRKALASHWLSRAEGLIDKAGEKVSGAYGKVGDKVEAAGQKVGRNLADVTPKGIKESLGINKHDKLVDDAFNAYPRDYKGVKKHKWERDNHRDNLEDHRAKMARRMGSAARNGMHIGLAAAGAGAVTGVTYKASSNYVEAKHRRDERGEFAHKAVTIGDLAKGFGRLGMAFSDATAHAENHAVHAGLMEHYSGIAAEHQDAAIHASKMGNHKAARAHMDASHRAQSIADHHGSMMGAAPPKQSFMVRNGMRKMADDLTDVAGSPDVAGNAKFLPVHTRATPNNRPNPNDPTDGVEGSVPGGFSKTPKGKPNNRPNPATPEQGAQGSVKQAGGRNGSSYGVGMSPAKFIMSGKEPVGLDRVTTTKKKRTKGTAKNLGKMLVEQIELSKMVAPMAGAAGVVGLRKPKKAKLPGQGPIKARVRVS